MCSDEGPPSNSFTVALQPPETTGQDYKSSQEDELPSASSCNLWLGQFDWHTGGKHDADGLCLGAFITHFVDFPAELQGIMKNLLQLFLMWHCVTVCLHVFVNRRANINQAAGITYDLHFFYFFFHRHDELVAMACNSLI